ncbi:MAG: redoxin domain-containing protein [Syntrophobacterales bacterium]
MYKRTFLIVVSLFLFLIFGGGSDEAYSRTLELIQPGDLFPETNLKMVANPLGKKYLGLKDAESFTVNEIKADLILVEIMSVYCPSCQRQMRTYNKLFDLIENNPETKARIKMIGIAVGNSDKEVENFREKYEVPFPIIPDPHFVTHKAIGGSRTPFAIYVRQDPSGRAGVVVSTHLGFERKHKKLFSKLSTMMSMDLAAIRKEARQKKGETIQVKPVLTEQELEAKIKAIFATFNGKATQLQKVTLRSSQEVYTALIESEGAERRLFAKSISRPPTCDLCHDIHFIYVFDSAGEVLRFEPIHLTKYGNKPWDDKDIAKMRERLIGRYVFDSSGFDPEVDAVSSATITSAIIIDAVFREANLLQELRAKGLN